MYVAANRVRSGVCVCQFQAFGEVVRLRPKGSGVKATGPMHQREFRSRFRRHAFGWRSQPAIQRIRQAVTEIKQAARRDPVLGAEGAVLLLERISPALETSTAHPEPSERR
jgi:hypothetical protein